MPYIFLDPIFSILISCVCVLFFLCVDVIFSPPPSPPSFPLPLCQLWFFFGKQLLPQPSTNATGVFPPPPGNFLPSPSLAHEKGYLCVPCFFSIYLSLSLALLLTPSLSSHFLSLPRPSPFPLPIQGERGNIYSPRSLLARACMCRKSAKKGGFIYNTIKKQQIKKIKGERRRNTEGKRKKKRKAKVKKARGGKKKKDEQEEEESLLSMCASIFGIAATYLYICLSSLLVFFAPPPRPSPPQHTLCVVVIQASCFFLAAPLSPPPPSTSFSISFFASCGFRLFVLFSLLLLPPPLLL